MTDPNETGFLVPPAAIVNQIQTLLGERYKEGFPIIKEILQNANDGRATRLDIGVTPGLKDNSLHPLLRQPALFFVNNGIFRDEDSQAIGWIGVDFNAGNSSKIGKFGLGQKSVFHFCEAFFYIASSSQLSEKSKSYRFLTPWADGSPMSDSDKLAVENYLKNIFLKEENNYSQYFILWLPLRSSNQPRCILPNIYDCQTIQEHFPIDASIKIGKLLPLLNSLESIYYWIPNDQNNLIKSFKVEIEDSQQRFSYPKAGENFCESNLCEHLSGSIQVSDSIKMSYAGIEATLPEDVFYPLMANIPEECEDHDHFWSTLSNLANWPKRSTYDQTGQSKVVPDKAVPHCGAVFLRYPSEKTNSNLTLQWAVFLPLEEIEENNLTHEEIPIHSTYKYTLVLHGYFFLDSGRRSIEGITQIYGGQINIEKPKNKDEMIQKWNFILATEGTLSKILPALEVFSRNSDVEDSDISSVCLGLLSSKLFQKPLLHPYLYESGYWIYQVKRNSTKWQLVSHNRILSLPDIPNWEVWSELEHIANHAYLILKDKPNLLPHDKPDQWNDDEIIRTLAELDILQVFQDSNELNFLIQWLDIIVQNDHDEKFSDDVQDHLRQKIKIILTQSDWTDFGQVTKTSFFTSVVPRLNESRWFCLDTSDIALFKHLNEVQDRILLLPQHLSPEGSNNNLSGNNAARLISELIEYREQNSKNSSIESLVLQIVQAVKETEKLSFREQVKNLSFISGYNCRYNRVEFYSLNYINYYNNYILKNSFNQNKSHNKLEKALQNALENKDVILIDRQLTRELCIDLEECNNKTCFRILGYHPHLTSPSKRVELLKELLRGHDIQALRFLLHGYSEHYKDLDSLYIASQINPAWIKVASFVIKDWQNIPQELAQVIPQDRWEDLKISPISPENLLQHLNPSQLKPQDFTPEERQEILNQVSAYGKQELWRSLPLHTSIDGSIVPITDNAYLKNPQFYLPPQLESHIVLIEKTNRPDWIQTWNPKAAIATILKLSDPEQYCSLLLELIPKVTNLQEDDELLSLLKEVSWLQLKTKEGIEPNRVIILPELLSSFNELLQNVFSSEDECYYVNRLMLFKDIQGSKSLKIICKTWYYNDILNFLLEQTNSPSKHVLLILNILTSLEKQKQSLRNDVIQSLKRTKWLVDSEEQPRSPEQIINLPGQEFVVRELLTDCDPKEYISRSMLREDLDISGFTQILEWLISGKSALEKLGEIVYKKPKYYLGNLPEDSSFLENLISVLDGCQETSILALSQDREAFKKFIFPKLLQPLQEPQGSTKITNILNWIIQKYNNPNKKVIQVFNSFLSIAYRLRDFTRGVLPGIKLLNQSENLIWKASSELCDGQENDNIDPEFLLNVEQRSILSSYLDNLAKYSLQEYSDSNNFSNSEIQEVGSNADRLNEYFSPWLQYVPSQAIGGILTLLAGDDKILQRLAQNFLQRHSFNDLRDDLIKGTSIYINFGIKVNEGKYQTVRSIEGKFFEAILVTTKIPKTIFIGEIRSQIILRKINFSGISNESLLGLLFSSFKTLVKKLDGRIDKSEQDFIIENIWERLTNSKQLEVEAASHFILKHSSYILRSLKVHHSRILEKLKEWDDYEFKDSDLSIRTHHSQAGYKALLESSEKTKESIKEIQNQIFDLIESNSDVQNSILISVRKKIGEYGYHANNIPFEIFQNADDAVTELKYFASKVEPERKYFVLKSDFNSLIFMHWGRPINKFSDPDYQSPDLRDKGFEKDLIKMLSFNITDKSEEQTGKFGLGFKTVYLVASQPIIVSGDLSFKVCGGILPVSTDLTESDNLRAELSEHQLNSTFTDGTLISLNLEEDFRQDKIIDEFVKQANLLLVFARAIRKCKLIINNYASKELEWNPISVFSIPEIEIGDVHLLDSLHHWKLHRLLNFKLPAGNIAVVIPENFAQDESPLRSITPFWVTAPTKEDAGLRFIINSSFDVTTGRTRLDPNSFHNEQLMSELGKQLGKSLVSLFEASRGENWDSLEKILNLRSVNQYQFWNFLWNVFAVDWLHKSKDSVSNNLIKTGLGGISKGIGSVINSHHALPNDLSDQLVCLQDLTYQVCGLLAESKIFSVVTSWKIIQQKYPSERLIKHTVWRDVKKLVGSDSLPEILNLNLSDCLREELGDRNIDVITANRIGQVINIDQMKNWEISEKIDHQKINEVLQSSSISFMSQSNSYLSAPLLLLYQPKDPEEKRLVAFAPSDRILNSRYTETALKFFCVCRSWRDSRRETIKVNELVRWAKIAETENQKKAVLQYLLDGDQSLEFADKLRGKISNTWMENDPGVTSLLKTKEIQKKQNQAIQGQISWEEAWGKANEGDENEEQDEGEKIPDPTPVKLQPSAILHKIYDWWTNNRSKLILEEYERQVYPDIAIAKVSIEDTTNNEDSRQRWMILFMLGMFHTMGRQNEHQHRRFLEHCHNYGWLSTFSESPSEYWLEVLETYFTDRNLHSSEEVLEYYQWLKNYPGIYALSKWFSAYQASFLELDKLKSSSWVFRPYLRPKTNPSWSGSGIADDAPPIDKILGIGANFILRELIRLGVIKNKLAHFYAYVPTGRFRSFLCLIGCPLPQRLDSWIDCSQQIYHFMREKLGDKKASFMNDFDIPFLILLREENKLRRIQLLGEDLVIESPSDDDSVRWTEK